jgi:cullin 1
LIDRELVKTVVDSYVRLGVDDKDLDKVCLKEYQKFLETPFIEATEVSYREHVKSSGEILAQSRMDELLKAEEDRVMQCLNAATWEVLNGKLE